MAFQHGTVEEQEVVKATWKELAAKFFTAASENNKPNQYHRTKVFEWLCATEHELKVATGSGWGQFKVPSENKPPAAERKSVTVTVDQGADGWSALQYLAASGHNIVPINGPSHRVWNDAQLAMQDAGLQTKLLASTIILNADGGPWHTSRWWQAFNVTHNMTDNIHKIKQAGPQYGQKGHLVDTNIEPGAPIQSHRTWSPLQSQSDPQNYITQL